MKAPVIPLRPKEGRTMPCPPEEVLTVYSSLVAAGDPGQPGEELLEGWSIERVARHTERCATCRESSQQLTRSLSAWSAAATDFDPRFDEAWFEDLASGVLQRIEAIDDAASAPAIQLRPRPRRRRLFAAAAALAAALLLAMLRPEAPGPSLEPELQAALEDRGRELGRQLVAELMEGESDSSELLISLSGDELPLDRLDDSWIYPTTVYEDLDELSGEATRSLRARL